jgi:Dyp-type peroxidase family
VDGVEGQVTALEREDIQGNVLRGYGFPFARYVFARVREAGPARRWLAAQADPVTTDAEWDAEPSPAYNVAISFAGLQALGLPAHVLHSFPADFREGMAARADRVGDVGAAAPANWDAGMREGEIHVLLTLTGSDEAAVAREAGRLQGELGDHGLEFTVQQPAAVLPTGREHFGFSDGFGQPAIAGVARDVVPGQGVPVRRRPWQRGRAGVVPSAADPRLAWRALAPGEFVLGYDDEDGGPPPAPLQPLGRNGTFMVWRKLEQDVPAWRAFLDDAAAATGLRGDAVAAKVIGRWPDGSPLVLRPDHPDEALGNDRARVNDFSYARDAEGLLCPRGAHVRRANPRDALTGGARLTARHRMLRRGMPYGDPLPPGALPDEDRRGLVFVCLQASIERQFEIVQARWCNDGDAFGLGRAADPIAGAWEDPPRVMFNGRPPRFASAMSAFVTPRGGEYLFVPGIAALRALADLASSASGSG